MVQNFIIYKLYFCEIDTKENKDYLNQNLMNKVDVGVRFYQDNLYLAGEYKLIE